MEEETKPFFTRFYIVGIVDKNESSIQRDEREVENSELRTTVIERFSTNQVDETLEKAIQPFCFPEIHLAKSSPETSMFVFVLTDSLGVKQYAFCKRRQLVKRDVKYFPECICLLSHHPWFSTFSMILEVLENQREIVPHRVEDFLTALLDIPLPAPTERFTVKINNPMNSQSDTSLKFLEYSFERPNDLQAIQHHIDYSDLLQCFKETKIVRIFASLLNERRVLFISSDLSRLSSVIHASVSLTHPFAWQHVFIPILPSRLIDYCLAPMPFVIGIHSTLVEVINKLASSMDEVVIVDIDAGTINTPFQDVELLPEGYLSRLKTSIKKFIPQKSDKALFSSLDEIGVSSNQYKVRRRLDQPANSEISESFLNFLASIYGNYHTFFDVNNKFLFQDFKNAQPKHIQPFLEMFSSSQMFEQFISDRSKRKADGLDIGFQTVGRTESNFQKWAISSRKVGKRFKNKAGKTFESFVSSSKNVTQKSMQSMQKIKSDMAKTNFKAETFKLFSPTKLSEAKSKEDIRIDTTKVPDASDSHSLGSEDNDSDSHLSRSSSFAQIEEQIDSIIEQVEDMINKESRPSFSQEGAKERATEEIKEEEKNLINLNSPTEPSFLFSQPQRKDSDVQKNSDLSDIDFNIPIPENENNFSKVPPLNQNQYPQRIPGGSFRASTGSSTPNQHKMSKATTFMTKMTEKSSPSHVSSAFFSPSTSQATSKPRSSTVVSTQDSPQTTSKTNSSLFADLVSKSLQS